MYRHKAKPPRSPSPAPPSHPGRDADAGSEWRLDRRTDPRRLQVHRDQPPRDVPYLPSDQPIVEAMLDFAHVGPGDVLYDLGCGDGRIVITAARRGARGVGVDIDLLRIRESYENAKAAGVGGAKFLRQSFFDTDIRDATVVTLYLLPAINKKLIPKLLWDLRPGTRIVSNYFEMGDWQPDLRLDIRHRVLYQWIVPAWVQGEWECVLNDRDPTGGASDRRRRMRLSLKRHYQFVRGTARFGRDHRDEVLITDGRLRGDVLTFTLSHPKHSRPRRHFECRYDGRCLRGICRPVLPDPAATPVAWGAMRG